MSDSANNEMINKNNTLPVVPRRWLNPFAIKEPTKPPAPNGKLFFKKSCSTSDSKTGLQSNKIPKPELAINEFNIDTKNSFMIGDRPTDLMPAEKLGITPVLIKTGYGLKSLEKLKNTNLNPIVANDILDFAKILKNRK